jgi:hypothetical protein
VIDIPTGPKKLEVRCKDVLNVPINEYSKVKRSLVSVGMTSISTALE